MILIVIVNRPRREATDRVAFALLPPSLSSLPFWPCHLGFAYDILGFSGKQN